MYFCLGILVGCTDASSVWVVPIIFGFFVTALVIFSATLFSTKLSIAYAIFGLSSFRRSSEHPLLTWLWCQKAFVHTNCLRLYPFCLQRIKIHSFWQRFDLWLQWNISLYTYIINNQSQIYSNFDLYGHRVLISKPYLNILKLSPKCFWVDIICWLNTL